MRAGQGFGRWGFILGNVLIAFGAPVFVTSLIAAVAAGRSGAPTRGEDVTAIAAGALFMIAGLIVTVTTGKAPAPVPSPPPAVEPLPAPRPSALEPLPLTLNTLDDYYTRADDGGVALDDGLFFTPPERQVPRPRNARGYCEPITPTGTRSTGSRRRPQVG